MITDRDGNILYGAYMHIITHQMHLMMDAQLAGFNLTHQQSRTLIHLLDCEEKRPVYQHEFEENFKIKRSSVTSLLNNLEKKTLIARFSDCKDGRTKRIALTPFGKTLAIETKDVIQRIEEKLVGNLSQAQKDDLIHILDIIVKNMQR